MNNYQIELTEEQEKILLPLLETLNIKFRKIEDDEDKANKKKM